MRIKLSLIIILGFTLNSYAQWEKVANYNVGVGAIAVHGSTVFLYGYQGKQFVYRSSDNGVTWTDIASKFPAQLITLHGHGNYVFAIGIGYFYQSTDDGITWTSKITSGVPTTVAFINLISDGNTLYALSNRNQVLKSIDNGSNWTQINLNYSQAQVFGYDFAASGNRMVFCAVNLGAFISTDGGVKWTLKNPKIALSTVHAFNGEIYGSTYGMYKFTGDTGWVSISSGFPAGLGVTASTRSTVSSGNKLFTYYSDVITQTGKVFASDNNGASWYELGNNLPPNPASSLNDFLAATPNYVFFYNSNTTSVFRIPIQTNTAIERNKSNFPIEFSLEQNYPNPFNPSTTISYNIQVAGKVTLKVFDLLGREVATLVDEVKQKGSYNSQFTIVNLSGGRQGSQLTSGVYFYTLTTAQGMITKKMIITK